LSYVTLRKYNIFFHTTKFVDTLFKGLKEGNNHFEIGFSKLFNISNLKF